jgi:hypothetical protein
VKQLLSSFALVQKGYDCHIDNYGFHLYIASSMLDNVCEKGDVFQPLDEVVRWNDSLALRCFIKLIERLPCPWLRLRFFF